MDQFEKEDVEKRLETVRNILRSIAIKYPNETNFLFIENIGENKSIKFLHNIIDYIFLDNFEKVTTSIFENVYHQLRYKKMAESNQGYIVICVDNSGIETGRVSKNCFYNVLNINVINGESFYELEFDENTFYHSRYFNKILPTHSFN